ncbi:MAG TPA: HAMP domain-containing sensor histidine kinase, partial [Cyclobacteriaceae bacterium]
MPRVITETIPKHASLVKWKWWSWPLLLAFLVSISYSSYFLRNFTDSVLLYLPTPFAIILLYWYGPRMLPIIYINEIVTLVLWGAPGGWTRILLLATHAPAMTLSSWYFFKRTSKESLKDLLSSKNSLIRFTVLGVLIPVLVNTMFTYNYTFVNHDLSIVFLIFLSDFLTILTIALPVLFFLAPSEKSFRIVVSKPFTSLAVEAHRPHLIQFWLIVVLFVSMVFFVDFDSYWYIYGVISIIVAIQQGFATVILINAIIFVLNYVLPLIDFADLALASKGNTKDASIHLGMLTMIISSSLIGRVISDLWKTEYQLTQQKGEIERKNLQLVKTNTELDRFVYSLSHDISAPLKSIKGLVNLSKLEDSIERNSLYLSKMDESIDRLESFIAEVLDYSRTNRTVLKEEEVHLESFLKEIINDFRYLENFEAIKFDFKLNHEIVTSDKFLLKVIFNNLISNAIKYQSKSEGHK